MDPLRTLPLLLFPGLLQAFLQAAEPVEHPFRAGGRVEMRLEAGEYDILPADSERISVTVTGPRTERVRVHLEGSDRDAFLAVTHTSHSQFKAVIRVPSSCDLVVRHSAGDLRIGAVRGHKDVRLRAGNLELKLGDLKDYASVDAHVTAGEIDARAFHVNKGGLFRGFTWTGTGKYEVRARLTAGDLVLE